MNRSEQELRDYIIRALLILAWHGLTVLIEVLGSKEGLSIRLLSKCVLILIKEHVLKARIESVFQIVLNHRNHRPPDNARLSARGGRPR